MTLASDAAVGNQLALEACQRGGPHGPRKKHQDLADPWVGIGNSLGAGVGMIAHLIRDLRVAGNQRDTGVWLATAMQSSWDMASALIEIEGLSDMLGERHRIIANDWHAAHMNALMSCILDPAADILERVDFAPNALRANMTEGRAPIGRIYSTAELVSHAADLCSDSAGLVHDNERRWRTFREGVKTIVGAS